MPTPNSIIAGLDIGTSSIKVVIGEKKSDGSVDIIGVGSSPSRGLRKGVVVNIEGTVSAIGRAVAQAETMAGCEISSVLATISGSHLRSQNSHGIVAIKNNEVAALDIERVIDAAKAVAVPLDREILHVLPQEFVIDEQDGVRDPLGISGVRLEARVHIITGAIASAQNIVKCANRCGLAVQDIVAAPIASGRAVLSSEEQELGVLLLDIGGGTCSISVVHAGAIKFTSVLAVGGNHITNDIAAGLRTPLLAAERIKCEYGTAITAGVSKADIIEVPSVGGRPPRVLSKLVLAEIIEPRASEIFALIQREIIKAGCEDLLTSGVVVTGGTANLPGITQIAESVFNLPVRIGTPTSVGGLLDLVKGAEYAAAVGLVLHGATQSHFVKRGATAGKGRVGSTVRRVVGWFSEHF
ncbi:MAG: cell division protein FtsA [Pseudomonadota bacterium]|jgi:cell division protein FtsA